MPSISRMAPEITDATAFETGTAMIQDRDGAGAIGGRKPVGEIEDDAREEPGLGHAQQKAQHEEADRAGDGGHQPGDDAPRDHDARDPQARADSLQHHVARHLEQRIAEEEDAGAPAVQVGAQAQVLVHGERRKGDVGAIDVRDEIAQRRSAAAAATRPSASSCVGTRAWVACACCCPSPMTIVVAQPVGPIAAAAHRLHKQARDRDGFGRSGPPLYPRRESGERPPESFRPRTDQPLPPGSCASRRRAGAADRCFLRRDRVAPGRSSRASLEE